MSDFIEDKPAKSGRLNVNVGPEAARGLAELQEELTDKLGFRPSLSQVLEYLIKDYFIKN
jgi:hypothetical protein